MTKNKSAVSIRMLVVEDVAECCRVSEKTVYRWIKDGDLAVYRLGQQLRISETDFLEFLEKHRG